MKIQTRATPGQDWLRCYQPRPSARIRLVCFPHAGGNAAFYRSWAARLPGEVELLAVQYPGRMDRASEPLIRRMDEMAGRAAAAVAPLARIGPVALFGHSLGASVAHETARRLTAQGLPPAALAVSGRPAPHRLRDSAVHLADDDTLWAELGRLGGTGNEVLDSDPIKELALPVLRADYEAAETYTPGPPDPLPVPTLAFTGDDDPEVTLDEAEAWAEWTCDSFRRIVFPGGHFYLVPGESRVVGALLGPLSRGWGAGP
ncbi:thioesterase II family protein [Nonomuraea purpurea]|uniref:Thioesterase II family protein n=1 Tax=Nonomuraea purpurea TaxID=1849276 RepID=A0ABV8GPC4_9ACTN